MFVCSSYACLFVCLCMWVSVCVCTCVCVSVYVMFTYFKCIGDYKLEEMVGQKLSIAILSFNLVTHPIHCIREIVVYKWLEI